MSAPDQPPQRTMQSASPNPPADPPRPAPTDEKPKDLPADDSPELEVKIPIPFIKDGEITVSGIKLTRRITLCIVAVLSIAAVAYFTWWRQRDSDKHTIEKSPSVSHSPHSQVAIDSPGAKLTTSETSGPQSPGHVEGPVTYNIDGVPPSDHARALADKIIAERERDAVRGERDKLTSENAALREQLAEALSQVERDAEANVELAVEALRQVEENQNLGASQDYLAEQAESLYAEAARNREAFLQAARQLVAVAYYTDDHAAMKLWGKRVIEFEPDNVFVRAILGDYAMTHETLDVALAHYTAMLDATRRRCDVAPDDLDAQRDLSVSYERIGDVRRAQGRLDEALKAYDDGLAIRRRLAEGDPTNTEWQRDLSVSFNKIGDVRVVQGKLDEALKAYDDGRAIRRRLAEGDPTNTQWQRDLSVSFNKIGDVRVAQGKLDEALKAYDDGLAIARRLAEGNPTNTEWQRDLSVSFNKIGDVRVAQGRLDEALKAYDDGLAIRRRLAESDSTNTQWQRDLASSLQRTGLVHAKLGKKDAGLKDARTALAIHERLAAHDPSNTIWRDDVEKAKRLIEFINAMEP